MSCYDSYRHEREGVDAQRWGYLDREARERYDAGRRGDYDSCDRAFADGVDRERRAQEDRQQEERDAESAAERRAQEAAYERQREEDYLTAQAEADYPEPPPDEPVPSESARAALSRLDAAKGGAA